MSTANIYTKEKVDELLGKYFVKPSNITINTDGIAIGSTSITSSNISASMMTISLRLYLNGDIHGNIVPDSDSGYSLGTSGKKWNYLWVDYIGSTSYPTSSIYSNLFAYKGGTSSQTYPLMHMVDAKKYTSYASSMVTTSITSYVSNSYWSCDTSYVGSHQPLKICMGTFVKAGGDNARKNISFPISFSSAPLVFLQMGGGNAPGNIQYRNGELIAEITGNGFTTASSCSEQARMCYLAIGH